MENDARREPLPGGWLPPGGQVAGEPTRVEGLPPSREPAPEKSFLQRLLAPVVAAAFAVLKFGKLALLFVGKAKILTTSLSMLVSVAAYTLIFGLPFAVGFVVLLLIHEMGHVFQLRREGVEASAPLFIPFLGAAIAAKSLGADAAAEARVGLAGPILGTLGAAACVPLYLLTGEDIFRALAFTGFLLNLFNLLPVVPLDGGRAMAALAPWMWFVGLAAFAVLAILAPNPIIVIILIVGALDTFRRYKAYRAGGGRSQPYYAIRPRDRTLVLIVYLGLIAALVVGMDLTFLERDFGDT